MAPTELVERDERTESIENASYALGYKVLSFAILLDVMYRSLRFGEAAWDLMGIVILSGAVLAAYQHKHAILGKRWLRMSVLAAAIALVVAAVAAIALMRIRF